MPEGLHPKGCRYCFNGKWASVAGCELEHPENVDLPKWSAPEDWQLHLQTEVSR